MKIPMTNEQRRDRCATRLVSEERFTLPAAGARA